MSCSGGDGDSFALRAGWLVVFRDTTGVADVVGETAGVEAFGVGGGGPVACTICPPGGTGGAEYGAAGVVFGTNPASRANCCGLGYPPPPPIRPRVAKW